MNNDSSVERSIVTKSKNLYFFFGGIRAGIVMPPFEFYKASGIINENKIFLRDLAQNWYHAGLSNISNDIDTTALFIEREIHKIKPIKTYFVGNSMGGYAAILFSTLVGEGEAITFAPQTFISSELRKQYKDIRWDQQISKTHKLSTAKAEAYDLRQLLIETKSNRKVSIFVAKDNTLDYIHATHIHDCPGVHIFEFEVGGHSLVRQLRDEGKLAKIMVGKYA